MVKAKRGKKAAKDGSDDSDVEVDQEEETPVTGKKKGPVRAGFALLADDDDDMLAPSGDDDPEESEEAEVAKPVKKNKKGKKEKTPQPAEDESDEEVKPKEEAKGKKGKKKKKKEDSDEELEKMLADLKMEYAGDKPEESAEAAPKGKKKQEKTEPAKADSKEEDAEKGENDNEGADNTAAGKSAAQKKREKREREKANKKAQKGDKADDAPKAEDESKAETVEKEEEPEDDGKKKKGKKGAAAAAPADAKEEKKPSKKNKMIEALKEAQRKQQEEEERLRLLAEEEEKRLEELEEARLEAERKEAERKEKKKQKEKERKERLKAEGKLLTPKQKADRARAQAMLEALGVSALPPGEKKARPGTRIRPNKKNQQQQQQSTESTESADGTAQEASETKTTEEAKPETVPEDEIKESWELESEDEAEPKAEVVPEAAPVAVVEEPAAPEEPEASSDDQDDDEDDDSESESESESDEEDMTHMTDAERKRAKAVARIQKRRVDAEKNRTLDNLRAAVICVLGHVDTGKTKILDKLRRTSVQAGEAGGITQQIGATNVPIDAIKEQTKFVHGFADITLKLPGLLIIDTPGHASFSNLRSRGSSLCDMAILVVDIMHGLEDQTIESLNMLKAKKTPFIVALNKIDRLYDWQVEARKDIRDVINSQAANTRTEFERRSKDVILQFAEQGMNAALFFENPDPKTYVSMVPTSAITGEGMGNLLALLVSNCQNMLAKRLMYSDELQATVLEVKAITGLGTTIDCILVNGKLREGDTVVLAASDGGAVVTQIRSLLMPQPMKELRVKNDYIEYKEIIAAQGVKIAAKDLEKVIAGLNMLVANHPDEVDLCREEVVKDLARELGRIKLQDRGVLVQASTLGSLEALLEFLKDSKIPYSSVKIGPVVKRDVMRASTMLERDSQYGTILAFDVKVERDAQELADSLGVKIFQADIIYHLFDQFTAHREQLKQQLRQQHKHIAVFPCKLKILPQYVFNSRDPIVMGVIVEDGIVCVGTPICARNKEDSTQFVDLGIVTSIESNHKAVENARRGLEVCIKIENTGEGAPKMFGRHFDEKDMLLSKISRASIDACKEYFRDDLIKSDWQLMVELKKLFQIL